MQAKVAEWLTYLEGADPVACLVFLAAYAFYFTLKSYRWGVILRTVVRVPLADLVPVTVTGYAANLLVPHSGELLRSFLIGRHFRVSSASVLASIVVERMLDILTLLLFTTVILFYDNKENQYLEDTAYFVSLVAAGLLLAAYLALKNTARFSLALEKALFWLPKKYRSALIGMAVRGVKGVKILEDLRGFSQAGMVSILQWTLILYCNWLSLYAVGIHAEPLAVMLVVVLMTIGIALPTAPGYVGTTQVCFIVAGGVFGWPVTQTIAASVIYNILMSIPLFLWAGWYSLGLPGSRGWQLRLAGSFKRKRAKDSCPRNLR